MINAGRWEGAFKRNLNANEQMKYDIPRRDLVPVPELIEAYDKVNFFWKISVQKPVPKLWKEMEWTVASTSSYGNIVYQTK